jgi:hypothetical protein
MKTKEKKEFFLLSFHDPEIVEGLVSFLSGKRRRYKKNVLAPPFDFVKRRSKLNPLPFRRRLLPSAKAFGEREKTSPSS